MRAAICVELGRGGLGSRCTVKKRLSCHILRWTIVAVPISKSRNIPEVVIVRRGAGGVLGIWEGRVNWVKGGANGVSLQAT